jgi:hypothetical protein
MFGFSVDALMTKGGNNKKQLTKLMMILESFFKIPNLLSKIKMFK